MVYLITFIINIIIFGLFIHWILGFIKSTQIPQIEKVRGFLNRVFSPFLDLIRKKIKPLLKIDEGRYFDFSPLVLFLGLIIIREIARVIFK